jgi:hypothetical protein
MMAFISGVFTSGLLKCDFQELNKKRFRNSVSAKKPETYFSGFTHIFTAFKNLTSEQLEFEERKP